MSDFNEWVNEKERNINSEIFQRHFKFQRPSDMLKSLNRTNDKNETSKLVNMVKSVLSELKNEIEAMSEELTEIEKPSETIDIVEEILKFNKQNQQGLTPDQMLSRLPIPLA